MCGHIKGDKSRNKEILDKVGVTSMVDKLHEARLRWYMHVKRRCTYAQVRRSKRFISILLFLLSLVVLPFCLDVITVVRGISPTEKLFIGGDFNGPIGSCAGGYGEVHGGFGFGDRNGGGTSLLDFARAFELVIVNSMFSKREEHLITFQNMVAKTQIDYLLLRRCDRGLCEDCKVIPSENLTTQHWLLVMDVGILMKRKKRFVRWSVEDQVANCIREATREVFGVLKGYSGGHKDDWWWNDVVQGKVEAKKATYIKLLESTDEDQRRANRED
ncbi:uncharacterized protein [Nicotiana sylvestris]|uniref:uncharacterized protein n=1 Tax=Nicotiana sylvestris TaxID=4096 RepID=UPI00388CD7E8